MSVELLAPVGDFECLKAAVQNGADCVYLGSGDFNARNSATNFNLEELRLAVEYAKLRDVKVNFTLNTLVKEQEFKEAIELAKYAYNIGVDAVIVQDLGLASQIIKHIPNLPVHASTQMTVHNLEGVKQLEKIGIKRVVLSRELSLSEIEYITKNCNIEIEVFVHGALCVSYSGQCLFSSMVGGRSGNRGKCAQPCRLPYDLYSDNKNVKKGYLLSTRDLCALDYLPQLVKAGVKSFKIEGRLKNSEYVATVTRIYRKYLNMIEKQNDNISEINYLIDEKDKLDLMQVFNRGGFSKGYLDNNANNELVYDKKPNNMGIYLGEIIKYNANKAYIQVKLQNEVEIGDRVSINNFNYNISELLVNNENIHIGEIGQIVTLGRVKGEIFPKNKIYKISSKQLQNLAKNSYSNENKRIDINCELVVKENKPIVLKITKYNIEIVSEMIPVTAEKVPTSAERIIEQLSKTKNTQYNFNFVKMDIDNNIHIPSISGLNEIRRNAIEKIEEAEKNSFRKDMKEIVLEDEINKCNLANECIVNEQNIKEITYDNLREIKDLRKNKENKMNISILLNDLKDNYDYTKLDVSQIYVPLKYFKSGKYKNTIKSLCQSNNVFVYMPTIIRNKIQAICSTNEEEYKFLEEINNDIAGFVISNISQIEKLKKYTNSKKLIGNYTLNIYNHYTIDALEKMGISQFTISPELDKTGIQNLLVSNRNAELLVYGRIPIMTSNYCVLGGTNKCNEKCDKLCDTKNNYLEDRIGFKFPVVSENAICTIYNSKILSVLHNEFKINSVRIDILDETVEEINDIVKKVRKGERCEGKEYTNGNMNREI